MSSAINAMGKRRMISMERTILFLGLTVLALAVWGSRTQAKEPTCPEGKTLFAIMDSDMTYRTICLPIGGGE